MSRSASAVLPRVERVARDVARSFRVARRRADEIIAEVLSFVRSWRAEAERAQLSRAEQEHMAPAFRVAT